MKPTKLSQGGLNFTKEIFFEKDFFFRGSCHLKRSNL